jgi:hypothetical protein
VIEELKNNKKKITHWIWYIFPVPLWVDNYSDTNEFFSIGKFESFYPNIERPMLIPNKLSILIGIEILKTEYLLNNMKTIFKTICEIHNNNNKYYNIFGDDTPKFFSSVFLFLISNIFIKNSEIFKYLKKLIEDEKMFTNTYYISIKYNYTYFNLNEFTNNFNLYENMYKNKYTIYDLLYNPIFNKINEN